MPSPEESGLSTDRKREVRGTYIGGFPEPERAIRGAPEALRVLRGKVLFLRKCPRARALYRGKRDCLRGRRLDCFIVLW